MIPPLFHMFKKRYLIAFSLAIILSTLWTSAYCLFTDYETATFHAGCERQPVENPDPFTITYHANGGIFPALSTAGLYETGTKILIKTWDELTLEKLVNVSSNKIISFSTSLSGDLIVPEGITEIGDYAAENNTSLTGITLPSSLTSIGYMSFRGAANLSFFKILEGTQPLIFDTSAFHNCRKLSSIYLPKTLTTVGTYSFYNCNSITNVYYTGSEEDWALISFASGTTALTSASITYNYLSEDAPSDSETNCVTYENCVPTNGTYLEPVKENYLFLGWYTDPDCLDGNEFSPDTDLIYIAESFTAYAKWTSLTYDVVHKSTTGITLDTDIISGSLNSSVSLSPNQYTGYMSPDPQEVLFDSAEKKTIVFLYTPIEYHLTFYPEGGTLDSTELSYTVESDITLPVPLKEGYSFHGWYLSNDFSDDLVSSVKNSTGDKSYYAKWAENTFPVLTVAELPDSTFDSGIQITGTLQDNENLSSLLLNGTSVTADEHGNFCIPLTLNAGRNQLTLTATDTAGNSVFYKTEIHHHTGTEGLSYANGCYTIPQVSESYCPGHTWANYSWSCGRCGSYISTGPSAPSADDCPNHNVCAQDKGVVPHLISSGTNYCSSPETCSSWVTNYVYLLGCDENTSPSMMINIPKSSFDTKQVLCGSISDFEEGAALKINDTIVSLDENGNFRHNISLTRLINQIDVTVTSKEGHSLVLNEKVLLEVSPGLYSSNSTTLIKSWDSLLEENLLTITGDTLTACEWTLQGDLQISKDISHIGTKAFNYASNLNNIILPEGLLTIGANAFSHCEKVNYIIIPDSVTEIGSSAFYYCRCLKEFSIPAGITTIANLSFYYCSQLSEIYLPDTITAIENSAFSSCSSLESVYYQGTKDSWNQIDIGTNNDSLSSATINYQYVTR